MRIDEFDFDLPRERIAQQPCEPRDAARLLFIPASGEFEDRQVGDLPTGLNRRDEALVGECWRKPHVQNRYIRTMGQKRSDHRWAVLDGLDYLDSMCRENPDKTVPEEG